MGGCYGPVHGSDGPMNRGALAIMMVIVMLIAIIGAYAIINDHPDGPDTGIDDAYGHAVYGLVYGNADGDNDVDADDLLVISDIIEGSKSLDDHPLADADMDGDVDSDDYDRVLTMVEGGSTTVHVMDTRGVVVETPFPLTKVFMSGQVNSRVVISVLELSPFLVANATNSSINPILDGDLMDRRAEPGCLALDTDPDDADRISLSTVDFQVAIVEESTMDGYSDDTFVDLYESKGVGMLVFGYDGADDMMEAMATIGILVQRSDRADAYIGFCQDIMREIVDNQGEARGTATVMTVVMSNSVSGRSSDYHAASIMAGGDNLADFDSSTRKFPESSDNTWLLQGRYNPDYLIHFASVSPDGQPSSKTIGSIKTNFAETEAYKQGNYYVLNGVMPLPVRLAYMAELMYPECFTEGWAESRFQYYMDHFTGSDVDVGDYKVVWNTDEIKAM